MTRLAQNEHERLVAEARRVEALLRAALGMVEQADEARRGRRSRGAGGSEPRSRALAEPRRH